MMNSISPLWVLIAQALLVVHVLVTGRNRYWILLLLFLPLIGGLAYLIMELLPEWSGGIRGQRARREFGRVINPNGRLKQLAAAWEQSPNADNARHYSTALLDSSRFEEAESIINQSLSGLFSTEPNLLQIKARLRFEQDDPAGAVEVLDRLVRENPEFRSPEGHLLLARALEQAGQTDRALQEYRSVSTYFPGVEARYRLAMALAEAGDAQGSRAELEHILKDARLAPAHFRKAQAGWLRRTRSALKS
jgi:hypothetical protein